MSTKLTPDQFKSAERIALRFIQENGSITNRQLRELAGVDYDQAITFFNSMIGAGRLLRVGVASGIRYVLPSKK